MEEVINNHLQRMKKLQSIYEEGTGQHNILGILINELTEQLRQYNVVGRSEQLVCGRNITTCVFYKGGKCSNLEYCRDQTT